MIRKFALSNRSNGTCRHTLLLVLVTSLALGLAGCGNEGGGGSDPIAAAKQVDLADFPKTDGKKDFAAIQREVSAKQGVNILPAANDFVIGRDNRVPFGIFTMDRKPIWGPTVFYLSDGTDAPARGPFKTVANGFDVPERFQSETSKGDLQLVGNGFYTATIPAKDGAKKLNFLTLTKEGDGFEAAAVGLVMTKEDATVAPGEKVPAIDTPTLDDVNGDASKIDTRVPPSQMHDISLKDALREKKPIVLIFATPRLCASRVCGPVVDVAASVQDKAGDDVIFIHNEIYKDNDLNAGSTPQVEKFGLPSEPFTFVIGSDGRVVEQLQGPFVAGELEAALSKAGVSLS